MNYLEKADKNIKKVAENNVEVQFILYDKDRKEVILKTESYGQNRIDEEKVLALAEHKKWDELSQEDINANKAKAKADLDEIAEVQSVMDGAVKK